MCSQLAHQSLEIICGLILTVISINISVKWEHNSVVHGLAWFRNNTIIDVKV